MRPLRISRFLAAALMFCGGFWGACGAQSGDAAVVIKVQVFDSSDLSPLKEATVRLHGNQSILASGLAEEDGIVTVTFLYRPGTWVIVSAFKQGFVTNSAPWHASRIPLYASVSLYLLPQRPATLLLYDDVAQLLLGSPGSRSQPWVQLQRRAIKTSLNFTSVTLSAKLTSARSQYELGGFPYAVGLENTTAGLNSSWVELTSVAAVCATLTGPNDTEVQLSESVHISVPLPSDSPLKSSTSVPIWRFEERAGLWVKIGAGYIKKEGSHLTWSFVAPHLGYWLAAFPSAAGTALNPPSVLSDITSYHTIFLLSILGFLALLILILLCLLLYYCRRRCLKPRHHRKHASSSLERSRRDQGTSTSYLNLISSGHLESGFSSGEPEGIKSELSSTRDLHGSGEGLFKHKNLHSKGKSKHLESFPLQKALSTNTKNAAHQRDDQRRSCSSAEDSDEAKRKQGCSSDPSSPHRSLPSFGDQYQDNRRDSKLPEYSEQQATNHVNRPNSMNVQPGQLIFCHSMEQMKDSMYHSVMPTLVIPAHYMRLSTDLSAIEQAVDRQQQLQHDLEGIQVSITLPCQQSDHPTPQEGKQQNEEEKINQLRDVSQEQKWSSDSSSGPVHIPVLFNDSSIAQMNGEVKTLTEKKLLELGVKPHPLAWFVSLDGRANSLVRHSYIELGNEPLQFPTQENRAETYPGNFGRCSQRRIKEESKTKEGAERKARSKIHSKLPIIDSTKPSSSSENQMAMYPPEDFSMATLVDEAPGSRGGTFPRRPRNQDHNATDVRTNSVTSPDDDEEDDEENKKSPWQKREERPLMVFNTK